MKDLNYWLSVFLKCYNKDSTIDAKELGYSTCMFQQVCDKVCSYYVKCCLDDWKVIDGTPTCGESVTLLFLGIKRDECVINQAAYGHRNIVFLYHKTREYLWFDPEGSNKRRINIKPLLKLFHCQDYSEIDLDYCAIQVEPKNDNGYCAAWCYMFAFLSIECRLERREMIYNIIPKITGNMKLVKGFSSYFKLKSRVFTIQV